MLLFKSGYKFSFPLDANGSVEVVVTRKYYTIRNFPCIVIQWPVVLISLKINVTWSALPCLPFKHCYSGSVCCCFGGRLEGQSSALQISLDSPSPSLSLGCPLFLFPWGVPCRTALGRELAAIRQTCPSHHQRHAWIVSFTVLIPVLGRNSSVGSVLGSLSCLMQRRGFDPPLRKTIAVEGIFPMGSDSTTPPPPPPPPNSFG